MGIFVDEKLCNGCGTAEEALCVRDCPGDLMLLLDTKKAAIRDNGECWGSRMPVHFPITSSPHFETAEEKLDRRLRKKSAVAAEVVVPRRIQLETARRTSSPPP